MRPARWWATALVVALGGCGGASDAAVDVPTSGATVEALLAPARIEVGASVRAEVAARNADYRRAFLRTFTSLTPENAMKWEFVHPDPDRWAFQPADELVQFARAHGRRVRGHPLVWDQQLPAWVREAPREELRGILERHVKTLVRRYRDEVAVWDVVNEPLEPDGTLTDSIWLQAIGPEYIELAFRWAREADPDAVLMLNEIAAEHEGPKSRGLLRLARALRRTGAPIDGIGLQNHTSVSGAPGEQRLRELLTQISDLGLSSEITEMDVVVPPGAGPDALDRQARVYADAAAACEAVQRCLGLTVWGVGDAWSWKGADRRPLLLDADLRPKPALRALRTTVVDDR